MPNPAGNRFAVGVLTQKSIKAENCKKQRPIRKPHPLQPIERGKTMKEKLARVARHLASTWQDEWLVIVALLANMTIVLYAECSNDRFGQFGWVPSCIYAINAYSLCAVFTKKTAKPIGQ
jgi:hypothetical protein